MSAEPKFGPQIVTQTRKWCSGCAASRSKYFALQGDSGYEYDCAHPSLEQPKHIGYDPITPDWCPVQVAFAAADPDSEPTMIDAGLMAEHALISLAYAHGTVGKAEYQKKTAEIIGKLRAAPVPAVAEMSSNSIFSDERKCFCGRPAVAHAFIGGWRCEDCRNANATPLNTDQISANLTKGASDYDYSDERKNPEFGCFVISQNGAYMAQTNNESDAQEIVGALRAVTPAAAVNIAIPTPPSDAT